MSGVEPHRQGRALPDEVPVAEVDSCALLYSQLGLEGRLVEGISNRLSRLLQGDAKTQGTTHAY